MGQNFLSCDREQGALLPANVADWVPQGHLARFVVEVVDGLDLTAFCGAYRADGSGRPAHDPGMMVALVLYSYAIGVRSSRQIERRCVEDVAYRYLTANRVPDHVTINRFRGRHQDALSGLFGEVLQLCVAAGMVRVGTVAIDATKMAGDASLGANRTYAGLQALAREIFAEAAEIDAAEDELYGDKRGDELPDDLADPNTRPARIRQLLDEIETERQALQDQQDAKRQASERDRADGRGGRPPGVTPPKAQTDALFSRKRNLTDPDSAIVSHRGMLMQGYNVHAAVADGQVILAVHASSQANEHGQLTAMLQAARDNATAAGIEDPIQRVLADSGYWHAGQVTALQHEGLDVLVCPRPSPHATKLKPTDPVAIAMADRLADHDQAARYRRRAQIAEPVFAHIKYLRAITRLLRRGRRAVQAEVDLIATTHNLLKLYRHTPQTA